MWKKPWSSLNRTGLGRTRRIANRRQADDEPSSLSVPLTVSPPPWRTPQAYLVYVAALLLVASYAQAQPAKHSFSGLCAYYPGRGGGLTAAHKTLPFGTRVRVTDSKTGRSVIVVINDRGPFNKGRVLDLSTTAAKALGMMERGVVLVGADVL